MRVARLAQLLAAGDWPAAHDVLCSVVAPRWFLAGSAGSGGSGPSRALAALEGALQQLEPHAAEIDRAARAPGTWASGGGLYAGFLYLQVGSGLMEGWKD